MSKYDVDIIAIGSVVFPDVKIKSRTVIALPIAGREGLTSFS
jgi:hypothetical protein